MTPVQFAAYIRYKTKTNAVTFPDADILAIANVVKDDLAKEVTRANEDYFGMILHKNLIAGQRSYTFPTDVLNNIKLLRVKLDGITQVTVKEFDVNTYPRPVTEYQILTDWQNDWWSWAPMFDVYGNSLILYSSAPIIDVTDGLELWAIIYPEDLPDLTGTVDMSVPRTTKTFGMPRQLHFVWATRIIVEYKNSKEKPIPLTEREAKVDQDQTLAINALKGFDLNRSIVATVSDYSGNGQDY